MSDITNLVAAVSGDRAVELTWTSATGAYSAVLIAYSMNTIPSGTNVGTLVTLPSATTAYLATGLTAQNGEYYGFTTFTQLDSGASTGVSVSAYPVYQPGTRAWVSHRKFEQMSLLGYI